MMQSESPEPEVCAGWSGALEAAGHTVISSRVPSQGIQRIREGGVDLVVIDGSGGTDSVLAFASELDKLRDAPPFVLVSSSPDAPQISARLGAASFVAKPCSRADLDHVMARLV